MKRQHPSTSQVEEPQRYVRSCISMDPFGQSTAPHLHFNYQRVTLTSDERAVPLEEPRGFPPQVQSLAPNLHGLQPLAQFTATHVSINHQSLASSLQGSSGSASSTVPALISNPLIQFMEPPLIFHAPTGSQPSVRFMAPHLAGHIQSRTLTPNGGSLFMSSEASPAGYHLSAQLTVPHISQQHQNHMSALGNGAAAFFSTTPAGYQPSAQSTAQHLSVHHQHCTSAPGQNRHPIFRCMAPHLRGSLASASCERRGEVSSMDTTRALAQSRVETQPMRDPIQSTEARQVQIARQISSLQASRPDSSAPRLRQNRVGATSNHGRNENRRIMPADRHSGMRMSIDNMTYEELLALGERIGKVDTGLKTSELSKYVKEVICCGEQDEEVHCVICLAEFDDGDVMGKLKCGHEYHYSCLIKWLTDKAVCPICRCTPAHF